MVKTFECFICKNRFELLVRTKHHVSYFPEKIIETCRNCHWVIHQTSRYPELKPKKGDFGKFKKQYQKQYMKQYNQRKKEKEK